MTPSRPFEALAVVTRGAAVGAFATLTDLLALLLLVHAGVAPTAASLPALAAGVLVQFVGSKRITFDDRSPEWLAQSVGFVAVEAVAFALNLGVFAWGVHHTKLPVAAVRLAGQSLVYFGFSLPLWSLVFRRRSS